MKKTILANLTLLLVITIIGGYLILTGEEDISDATIAVSNIPPTAIKIITVIRPGSKNITFTRDGDRWHMTTPQNAIANPDRINAMLSILEITSHAQFPISQSNLEQFGLNNPEVILKLDEHEFLFGGDNPLGNRRYIMFADSIHLINDGLFHQLLQSPEFFVIIPEE